MIKIIIIAIAISSMLFMAITLGNTGKEIITKRVAQQEREIALQDQAMNDYFNK